MIPPDLIERAWAHFSQDTLDSGIEPDKFQFLGGLFACFGIMTGSLDIGITPGTATIEVAHRLQQEMFDLVPEMRKLEAESKRRTVRRNTA